MVEELKLAIKIDDASIEQSLLKQFANAQKMADKVVLDFKNVNFDDKQVEAKFKEMQKKAGQNPIDLTISDNALNMLGQIDKRLTEIFSIGKGKSFIDSSSITADIGKIENKINELDKKYEEAQKKLSSIGSGNISGKDVNLVDNAEFKKLSQEVSELKNQFDDLKTHMQLLDDYTVPTDRFFELQSQVEATTVKVSDLIDKFVKLSNAQKTLSSTPQESNISSEVSAFQQQEKIQNQVTQSIQEQNKAIDESIKKTLTLNDVRQKQWEIIQKTNPKEEGTNSTWVDKPEDAKTFYEVNHKDSDYPFNENYSDDWTVKDKMNVEATGKITVYSSYPIEDGNWVTPSKEEGLSYAGSGKLYSATMDPRDIAWVDAGQGQVAHISDELKEVIDLSTKAETQVQSIDNNTNKTGEQSTLNALDDTIAKYETIVSLVKEYYDLSNNKKDTIGISSDDERISEIRKQLKSYTKNPDYNGEYKMGFGGSGKNIFAKSVDLSQEEMLQEICNMLGVEIPKNADKAKEAIKEVDSATATTEQKKDAFPDKDISASVDSATNSIKEENNVLEQNTQKVKENTQAKEQNANVNFNKYDKRLDSYNGKIDKYKTTIDRFNDGGWTSNTYLKNVQAVKDAVKEYETLLNELKGKDASLVTSDDINRLDNYEKKIKDTIATVTNMSAAEKGYNFVSGQKELDKIHKLLNENSKMSSEAKAKIRAYYTEIESGNPSMSLDRIHGEIMKIYNAEVEAGRAGRSFFDTLKNSGFHKLAAQMSGMFGFYDVINIGKQAISTIVSLDDALLDLKKTTSMSSTELNNFYYSANDVAKQMGVTTKSIIEQASAWSRLGYSSNEQATEMAKLSSKFASISPGMDTDQAQEGMVSIMKAWQINPEDVEKEILDPINQLGNKFAESNNDIVEGMKRSAAALAAVGTDYKDAYSLFTGVQEVLQNSEVAGRALRSISMRIRGYDENSEDGFEQTDDELKNITGDLIDLTKTAQHAQGVSIFKEGSTTEFKSLVDYFGEIHDIWDEMSQKQQNDFLQKAFGKTQAQAGAALIQNYDAVKEALAEIDESAGSADKEMSTVEQTLSYKINALKETWVGCAQQILDRGDLGIAISGLNGVSKVITGLIDNVGLLKTAAMGVAATLSFKNVGGNKMHFPMNILDNIHNLLWIQRFRVCYP